MSEGTRERIVKAGAAIMHRKGFLGTGLQEVLDEAKAPRGSFYHYFKSKEDFALAVIDYHDMNFSEETRRFLTQESLSPMARLRAFFEWRRDVYTEKGFTCGCPIGNMAQEMGDLSEPLRARLNRFIDDMAAFLHELIQAGQEAGEVRPELDAREIAYFLVGAWQGALIRMKVTKSPVPVDVFLKNAFAMLLVAGHAPL
jgi:TetR/AcrR family transcriptional repressor of nem operon